MSLSVTKTFVFALTALSAAYSTAAGAITLNGTTFSISASVTIGGSTWGFALDPEGIQHTSFQMSYDTSLFAYNPSATGLLCDFSNGGDCPTASGVVGPYVAPIQSILPGAPRLGTEAGYNITVDEMLGLVTVNYDLSANPPADAGERNFFVLGLDALQPLSRNVVIHDTPGAYTVNLFNVSCTAIDAGNTQSCGSSSPAFGVTLSTVPEPASVSLMVLGMGFLAARRRGYIPLKTNIVV